MSKIGSEEDGSLNLRNIRDKPQAVSVATEEHVMIPATSMSSLITDHTWGFGNSGSSNNNQNQFQSKQEVVATASSADNSNNNNSFFRRQQQQQQQISGSYKPHYRLQQQFQKPRTSLRMSMARQMNNVAEELFTTRPSAALLEQTGFVLKEEESDLAGWERNNHNPVDTKTEEGNEIIVGNFSLN